MLPVTAVVPTRNRVTVLRRMLESLARQSTQPVEMIVVDASETDETDQLCKSAVPELKTKIIYHRAIVAGAIEQRNQAMSYATQDSILFMDDDIILEPECLARLWVALNGDESIGGVNAMITNQRYFTPGTVSRTLFRILHGRHEPSYAGKCIGPACNLLPEDRDDLPEVVEVEWLNTTCTLYRRAALPNPPFITHQVNEELRIPAFPQEDLALSLRVRKNWKLANARTARIYHDSQPGAHKANVAESNRVWLISRHYLMTRLLDRRRFSDYMKLILAEVFGVASVLTSAKEWQRLPTVLSGKLRALPTILTVRYPTERFPLREAPNRIAPSIAEILPVTAIVPTLNRRDPLRRMLESLARQSVQPLEMIVVDASSSNETKELCASQIPGLLTKIVYQQATVTGAATQRNQAAGRASQEFWLFLDDDVILEEGCLKYLWEVLTSDQELGGVNAMITNQRYFPPGLVSRTVFHLLNGNKQDSYAGKCIGPALNLLPEDREDLPSCVQVEWLNTGCTLYRREALPQPLFSAHFKGYSLMEDVALSLTVGRKWKLANARSARIFHDSQPGAHKVGAASIARMELVNRHYVMTRVLGRRRVSDYLKLALFQTFGVMSSLTNLAAWSTLPPVLLGKASAIRDIISSNGRANGNGE
jgi:glycosyltransferase involved in cell wall biosynthesis